MTEIQHDRRGALQLSLVLLAVSAFFTHIGVSTNDGVRYSLAKAIATRGTLSIDGILTSVIPAEIAVDSATFEGRTYSDKAPVGSFIGAVPAFVGHHLTSREPGRIWLTSCVMSALPFAAIGALLFLAARREGLGKVSAWWIAGAFTLGTNLFYWSTLMFSHAMTAYFVCQCVYLLRYASGGRRRDFLAGLCGGLAVGNDYYMIVWLPLLAAYVFHLERRRLPMVVLGAALAGMVPAAYHAVVFGNPFVLPHRYHTTYAAFHYQGVYGIGWFRPKALWDLFLGVGYGLVVFNPVVLLWVFLRRGVVRKNGAMLLLGVGMTLVLVGLVGSLKHPSYGLALSWGPRYLCPVLPVLALAILPAIDEAFVSRTAVKAVVITSAVLNSVLLLVYFQPAPFEGLRFLGGRGVEIVLSTGGLSLLGQLKALHGAPIPAVAVFCVNVAVLALPWGLCAWFKRGSPVSTPV